MLKGIAKDAYQRLLHGWAKSTTPTTSTTTPTIGQRGRPRRVSAGSSQLATPTGSTPSSCKCPAIVTSLYTAIKTAIVSSVTDNNANNMFIAKMHYQGSAHTGREWSAPTTTQSFLPPLELKIAYFHHHSESTKMLYSMIYNTIFHYSLATTQIILGRTLIMIVTRRLPLYRCSKNNCQYYHNTV